MRYKIDCEMCGKNIDKNIFAIYVDSGGMHSMRLGCFCGDCVIILENFIENYKTLK